MDKAKKNKIIFKKIESFTDYLLEDKDRCIEYLKSLEIIDKNGNLTKEYGGKENN